MEMKGRSDAEYLNDSAVSEHQYMCLVKKEDINPKTLAPNVVNRKLHELREYILYIYIYIISPSKKAGPSI